MSEYKYKKGFLVNRIVVLIFCLAASGCSSKGLGPKDIEEFEGNYIDVFAYEDLTAGVKSALKEIPDEKAGFSGKINLSVSHYHKDVLEWEGNDTKSFYPTKKGITRVKTRQFVNDFLSLTTYEMSYLGLIQFDVQSFQPGHRDFWADYRIVTLEFIEADPEQGMHYRMKLGRRFQIADYWERQVKCEAQGHEYEALTIHSAFKGQARNFKCSTTANGGDLVGVQEVAYLADHNLYVPLETRNISGRYVYKIESVEVHQ